MVDEQFGNNLIMKKEYEILINKVFSPEGKFNNNELKYILQFLDSENPENELNPWSARLEKAFSDKFNINFAIAHNSGTSTLHSCLYAAGVGAGDEVIGPVQTGAWFPYVCLHQNAIPVYVDSDPDTFLMDSNKIEEKITERTKAIIPTHMHGLTSQMDKVMEIAEKYNLYVIEDCAQSFLATYNKKYAGTIGHMSSFSFETKKHMTTGQGGMVLTNNENLAIKIRKHAGLGYKTLSASQGMTRLMPHEFQNPHFKRHDTLAYNYRLSDICAAIGLAQIEDLDNKVNRRITIANMYDQVLTNVNWIIPQKIPRNCKSSYWSYVVKYLGEEKYGISWEKFYEIYNNNGGDGFYGGLSLNTDEIFMRDKQYFGTYIPKDYYLFKNRFEDTSDNYPIAKNIQPLMMKFKTGYRDLNQAEKAVNALKKTIQQIQNNG
jgi:perosamine synthetase|tara:strand:- start:2048 stop:3346 length:1299 start_codon:yes stop_codon:yes gene_type:complete